MRIREGDFGYDIEQLRDPLTQIRSNWQFRIFRLHPAEVVISRGEAPTRAAAEKKAKAAMAKMIAMHDGPLAA